MPKTRNERIAMSQAQTVERATQAVLNDMPVIQTARGGGLMVAATEDPQAQVPTDTEGTPKPPVRYFRAGMRVGSAPIRRRR